MTEIKDILNLELPLPAMRFWELHISMRVSPEIAKLELVWLRFGCDETEVLIIQYEPQLHNAFAPADNE